MIVRGLPVSFISVSCGGIDFGLFECFCFGGLTSRSSNCSTTSLFCGVCLNLHPIGHLFLFTELFVIMTQKLSVSELESITQQTNIQSCLMPAINNFANILSFIGNVGVNFCANYQADYSMSENMRMKCLQKHANVNNNSSALVITNLCTHFPAFSYQLNSCFIELTISVYQTNS